MAEAWRNKTCKVDQSSTTNCISILWSMSHVNQQTFHKSRRALVYGHGGAWVQKKCKGLFAQNATCWHKIAIAGSTKQPCFLCFPNQIFIATFLDTFKVWYGGPRSKLIGHAGIVNYKRARRKTQHYEHLYKCAMHLDMHPVHTHTNNSIIFQHIHCCTERIVSPNAAITWKQFLHHQQNQTWSALWFTWQSGYIIHWMQTPNIH